MLTKRIAPRVAAVTACLVLSLFPRVTHAAGPARISPSLYPPHTQISMVDPLSNNQMDCDWGFSCEGNQPVTSVPLFHLRTQDDLHRLSGWAQFGNTPGGSSRMLFAVFASRYSPTTEQGMPWNVLAFSDFRAVLISDMYNEVDHFPRLIPKGQVGNSSAQLLLSRDGDMLAMTCWVGSIEVEGVAIYAHGSKAQHQLAVKDLSRQIRTAVNEMLGATS